MRCFLVTWLHRQTWLAGRKKLVLLCKLYSDDQLTRVPKKSVLHFFSKMNPLVFSCVNVVVSMDSHTWKKIKMPPTFLFLWIERRKWYTKRVGIFGEVAFVAMNSSCIDVGNHGMASFSLFFQWLPATFFSYNGCTWHVCRAQELL